MAYDKELYMQSIPSVDLNHSHRLNPIQIQTIGESLEKWGFVNLVNHGVELEKIQKAYQVAEEVFALDELVKKQYEDPIGGRQRGYTPFLQEKAKNATLSDLKEFWHIGRELSHNHPYRRSQQMRANLFPKEVPQFATIMYDLYQEMDRLAHCILSAIAIYLGYEASSFESLAQDGNSILRVLHYPDLSDVDTAGRVRAAAHEDINLLTLLPAATQPGLELLTRDQKWLPVDAPPNSIICDTGDMMSLLTQQKMPATTHRVVNPKGGQKGARLSMPFFMHPHPNAILAPLHKQDEYELDFFEITAHEFLTQRLKANHVV